MDAIAACADRTVTESELHKWTGRVLREAHRDGAVVAITWYRRPAWALLVTGEEAEKYAAWRAAQVPG